MINILFCGNDKVFDGILTTTLSILKRSKLEEPITFNIFSMDLTRVDEKYRLIDDKDVEILDCVVKEYNKDNKVVKYDVTDIYEKEFHKCPNEGAYCSPYTLIRLFADMVLDVDKLLYLDMDLMFNRGLENLYYIDIDKYEYAAARDHYGKFTTGINSINAGVLLFNMKKCRETGLFTKAREWIKTKKLLFADQSAIRRSTTKKKMLKQRFNDQRLLHKHTIIRHFSKRLYWFPYPHTDNIKQFHIEKVHKVLKYHQFDDIYEEYYRIKEEYNK